MLLVPALADQQLADDGLAVGHVEVRLDPHAAHDLPAAFLDALLDLRVHVGIFVGQPLVVLRGGLGVGVIGIFVHQLEGGAEGAADHVDGFGSGPEPGGVDVGVAGEVKGGLLEQRAEGIEFGLGGAEAQVEFGLGWGLGNRAAGFGGVGLGRV